MIKSAEETQENSAVLPKSAKKTEQGSRTLLEGVNEYMPVFQQTEKNQPADPVLLSEGVADAEGILPGQSAVDIESKDNEGLTPLARAAFNGDVTNVRRLLNLGAAINAKAAGGETALHKAAHCGYMEILEILLAAGAGVNAICDAEYTPLYEAATGQRPDIVQKLLVVGAEIEANTARGIKYCTS